MSMAATDLHAYLIDSFPEADIDIKALVDDDDHYAVTIRSKAFVGRSKVQQHQLVYQALKGHVGSTLHALSLSTHIKE